MHSIEIPPNVHFLNDAAHLLSHSAPETAAFLMSRRNELLVENDIPISDAQRQHACTACGHILIPGQQQDTLQIETEKAPRPRNKKPARAQQQHQHQISTPATPAAAARPLQTRAMPGGISKVLNCGNCSRETRVKLEGPKRISRVRKATQQSKVPDARKSLATTEPVKPSANASSKKRAKNRKAGLQALLDQKQGSASSSSGFGLSLCDFMKK